MTGLLSCWTVVASATLFTCSTTCPFSPQQYDFHSWHLHKTPNADWDCPTSSTQTTAAAVAMHTRPTTTDQDTKGGNCHSRAPNGRRPTMLMDAVWLLLHRSGPHNVIWHQHTILHRFTLLLSLFNHSLDHFLQIFTSELSREKMATTLDDRLDEQQVRACVLATPCLGGVRRLSPTVRAPVCGGTSTWVCLHRNR